MRAIYNDRNELVEQPEMEQPVHYPSEYDMNDLHYSLWYNEWMNYDRHTSSLRTLPCIEGIGFEVGKVYEENVHYKVEEVYTLNEGMVSIAVPIKHDQDELWSEAGQKFHVFFGHLVYQQGKRVHPNEIVKFFKTHYSITKKTTV